MVLPTISAQTLPLNVVHGKTSQASSLSMKFLLLGLPAPSILGLALALTALNGFGWRGRRCITSLTKTQPTSSSSISSAHSPTTPEPSRTIIAVGT